MRMTLKVGTLAAIALSSCAVSANAALIRLTFQTQVADDEAFIEGVFDEGELPLIADGSFQIVFDPSKSVAPTNDGLVYSSLSITYGIGEFIYGGFGEHTYYKESLELPTFYSYDAMNNSLFFGDSFASASSGAQCQSPFHPQSGHCGLMLDLQYAEGSYSGGLAFWNIIPGPFPIFYQSSYTVEAIPEPTTWALLLSGFAALGMTIRRRQPRLSHGLGYAGAVTR